MNPLLALLLAAAIAAAAALATPDRIVRAAAALVGAIAATAIIVDRKPVLFVGIVPVVALLAVALGLAGGALARRWIDRSRR